MRILLLGVLTGCLTSSAAPGAMHPTASATDKSVGVALGGAYFTQQNGSLLTIPYGEGWIRRPVGDGQLGLHIAPNVGHVSYRYDLMPLSGGVGVAIEPFLGGSYIRLNEQSSNPGTADMKESSLAFVAGLSPTILIHAGDSFAYVVPKFGFQYAKNLTAMAGQKDSTKSYVLGVSVGIDIGDGISFELAIHRLDDAETEMVDTPAGWLIVPTVGVRR